MASLPNAQGVTYEEWLRMPVVEDAIEEVVDGEIRIMPANKWTHAEIVQNLSDSFSDQLNRKDVRVVIANFGLIISTVPLNSRVPDLAIFRRATMVIEDGDIHSPPQLLVELLSPSNRPYKLERLLADYAKFGVPELWLLSYPQRSVDVRLLEDGELRRAAVHTEGILKPTQFPNVQIDIAQIWPD